MRLEDPETNREVGTVRKPRLVGITMPDGQVIRLTSGTDLLTNGPEAKTKGVRGAITEVPAPPKDATGADTTK